MSRTIGTTKVAVFETKLEGTAANDEMLACADLLGQAAEWLRSESVRQVQVSSKKHGRHCIYDLALTFRIKTLISGSGPDYEGEIAQLFVCFDDNEKE